MADYVAGRGTTALGIIGTVLGGIGTVAAAHPGIGASAAYEASGATMHDIDDVKEVAALKAEIGQLKSEKYADGVREDAKQYGIEIYKELKGNLTEVTRELTEKIDSLKEKQSEKWADQMVVNANLSNAITALDGQVKATAALVGQITRTAVPQSAICNFGGSCGSCSNNI